MPATLATLWLAQDNEPAEVVRSTAIARLRTVDGSTFPSLDFDDVPADVAAQPAAQYRCFFGAGTNVWAPAAEARTLALRSVAPNGYVQQLPIEADGTARYMRPQLLE